MQNKIWLWKTNNNTGSGKQVFIYGEESLSLGGRN